MKDEAPFHQFKSLLNNCMPFSMYTLI